MRRSVVAGGVDPGLVEFAISRRHRRRLQYNQTFALLTIVIVY
jgi:hypothetical protein